MCSAAGPGATRLRTPSRLLKRTSPRSQALGLVHGGRLIERLSRHRARSAAQPVERRKAAWTRAPRALGRAHNSGRPADRRRATRAGTSASTAPGTRTNHIASAGSSSRPHEARRRVLRGPVQRRPDRRVDAPHAADRRRGVAGRGHDPLRRSSGSPVRTASACGSMPRRGPYSSPRRSPCRPAWPQFWPRHCSGPCQSPTDPRLLRRASRIHSQRS